MVNQNREGWIDLPTMIQKAGDLQLLPIVARKVLEMVSDEDTTAANLKMVIEKDQPIAARILKIANSAFYGLRREVKSLQQAIVILGFRSIKNLVIAASTRSIYKRFGITEKMLWEHSVGCSIAAKVVTKSMDLELQETAFVGSLFHDIGKVIMNNETPTIYVDVMSRIYNDQVDALTAERDVYGYAHPEVGAGVVEKWGLPKIIVDIIAHHHRWESEEKVEGLNQETELSIAAVSLANTLCRYHGIGYRDRLESLVVHDTKSYKRLNIPIDRANDLLNEVLSVFEAESATFS